MRDTSITLSTIEALQAYRNKLVNVYTYLYANYDVL